MKDGIKNSKGNRVIISVSLPFALNEKLEELIDHYGLNRSAVIASAIRDYLSEFGLKVGEK